MGWHLWGKWLHTFWPRKYLGPLRYDAIVTNRATNTKRKNPQTFLAQFPAVMEKVTFSWKICIKRNAHGSTCFVLIRNQNHHNFHHFGEGKSCSKLEAKSSQRRRVTSDVFLLRVKSNWEITILSFLLCVCLSLLLCNEVDNDEN